MNTNTPVLNALKIINSQYETAKKENEKETASENNLTNFERLIFMKFGLNYYLNYMFRNNNCDEYSSDDEMDDYINSRYSK